MLAVHTWKSNDSYSILPINRFWFFCVRAIEVVRILLLLTEMYLSLFPTSRHETVDNQKDVCSPYRVN
jgi:hypothetical protein